MKQTRKIKFEKLYDLFDEDRGNGSFLNRGFESFHFDVERYHDYGDLWFMPFYLRFIKLKGLISKDEERMRLFLQDIENKKPKLRPHDLYDAPFIKQVTKDYEKREFARYIFRHKPEEFIENQKANAEFEYQECLKVFNEKKEIFSFLHPLLVEAKKILES